MSDTVYTIAFVDNEFFMIFNTKRNGWEMPGGHIEPGESVKDAAVREFMEESGYTVDVVDMIEAHDCFVRVGTLGEKITDGEMNGRMFKKLPDKLSFDRSEYETVMKWACTVIKQCQ